MMKAATVSHRNAQAHAEAHAGYPVRTVEVAVSYVPDDAGLQAGLVDVVGGELDDTRERANGDRHVRDPRPLVGQLLACRRE